MSGWFSQRPDSPFGRMTGRFGMGWGRVAALGGGLVLAIGLVAMVFAVQVSSTPQFCGSCHIMKPYFESWKNSKHNGIACVDCHISPGITAEIRKKYEALSMVAKYFTGTYSTNPWAEVDDAACLRCHERRLLEGKEVFHSVLFDHTPHLTESRRGLKLRCTSCHSQIVQGSHIAVTSSTCALCHFKNQSLNQGLARCLLCHQVPERVVSTAGVAFDHSQVKRLDMDCRLCHGGVVRGAGTVPRERCLTCHNEPSRLAKLGDRQFLHQMHVTTHKVDCMNCHLTIEHGKPPAPAAVAADSETPAGATGGQGAEASASMVAGGMPAGGDHPSGNCLACHGSGHSPQQDLYTGVGGRGVPRMPSPMFAAGVRCEGCHNAALTPDAEAVSADAGIHTVRASAVSCMSCHGPGYLGIYQGWKQGVDERVQALGRQLEASAGAMGLNPPQAWLDARHNFNLVQRGHGIHNVNFSYALLAQAHEQLNVARRARGMALLARPWTELSAGSGNCMTCHRGVENLSGTFEGRTFAHAPHVTRAKLACDTCHRPHKDRAPGEVVKFGADGCLSCHHQGAVADVSVCGRCHGDVTGRSVTSFRGEFSHKAHIEAELECRTCHTMKDGDPRPQRSACAQCHEGG